MNKKKIIQQVSPFLILFVISAVFTVPIFKSLHNTGKSDWDQHCFLDEISRKTILDFGQLPLWNPYENGGRPLLAHPVVGFLRPTFLFTLLFGCVVGLKIEVFFMVFIGMVGMFLLSRQYGMRGAAGILSAAVFGLSSFFSLHIAEGHIVTLNLYLLPFVFLFFLKSFEQRWYLLISAIFLAIINLGMWSPLITIIPLYFFLIVYSVLLSFQRRNFRPFFYVMLLIIISFSLSAVKMMPVAEYLIKHPRGTDIQNEITTIKDIYHVFLGREQNFGPLMWGWHEYGAYTGLPPLILLLLALLYFWRKEAPLILSGLLAFFVSLGDFAKWAPWSLMHRFPFMSSTRVPSRFIIIAVFVIAILAGLVLELFYREVKHSSKAKYFLIAIIIFIILDLLMVNTKPFTNVFPNSPIEVSPGDVFQQIVDDNPGRSGAPSSLYLNLLANTGTLYGYDAVPHEVFAKSFDDPGYKGEVYLESNGNASYSYWSPNKLIVEVDAQNTTHLIINQNYDKGWRVKGKVAESFLGLLSTNVTPSDKTVEFYYLPSSFVIGLVVTLISIIITLFSFKSFKK